MLCETTLVVSFYHVEDRYTLDVRKVLVTEKFQVGRVGVNVHPAVQDCDGVGLLFESLATVRIVPYDIAHRLGG